MIVFVEGVDGSGKSTLVETLSSRYCDMRVPKDADCPAIWSRLMTLGKSMGTDHILLVDRSPLTDYVYRAEDLKESKYNFSTILKWLKSGKLIYCRTDNAYEDAMVRGEDNLVDKSRHEKVKQLYDTIVSALSAEGVKVLHYNWRTDSLDKVIDFIEGGKVDEPGTT